MAQHKSAEKQARKSLKNRERNRSTGAKMKTALKRVKEEKDKAKAEVALKKAYQMLDRLATKGFIHKNNAARHKSQLIKMVSALQSA